MRPHKRILKLQVPPGHTPACSKSPRKRFATVLATISPSDSTLTSKSALRSFGSTAQPDAVQLKLCCPSCEPSWKPSGEPEQFNVFGVLCKSAHSPVCASCA